MGKVVRMEKNLVITRKAVHEVGVDIRRAAVVTHTSMTKIQKALDEKGAFEDKFYLISKILPREER